MIIKEKNCTNIMCKSAKAKEIYVSPLNMISRYDFKI